LSEISYANCGYIAINQNPFMVFGVLQIKSDRGAPWQAAFPTPKTVANSAA